MNRELALRAGVEVPAEALPDIGRKRAVGQWCAAQGINPPSERAVAHHLIERLRSAQADNEPLALLDPARRRLIQNLQARLQQLVT